MEDFQALPKTVNQGQINLIIKELNFRQGALSLTFLFKGPVYSVKKIDGSWEVDSSKF